MTRTFQIALTAMFISTGAFAQVAPESIASQLQADGITDIVIYNGRGIVRATGNDNGEAVELFFDRRTGEAVDAPPNREERAEVRDFIEGLRASFDPETDGSFRDYVAQAATEAGVELPERGSRRSGERLDASEQADRPERSERAGQEAGQNRPDRGAPRG